MKCLLLLDIVKAPAEHHPGPLQAKSGPHRFPPGSRRGGRTGNLRAFLQKLSQCPWRILAGAPPNPCRADYGLEPGYISRRGPGYFQVGIKSNPGPVRGEKNGRHPVGVPPGPVRYGQKTAKNSLGTAREGSFCKM